MDIDEARGHDAVRCIDRSVRLSTASDLGDTPVGERDVSHPAVRQLPFLDDDFEQISSVGGQQF
jgi:hypothetical protein